MEGPYFWYSLSKDDPAYPSESLQKIYLIKNVSYNLRMKFLLRISKYRVSHSEMNDSKWLWGVVNLRIFLSYGG